MHRTKPPHLFRRGAVGSFAAFLSQLADRVADKATSAFAPSGGAPDAPSGGAAAAAAVQGSMDIEGATKALDWWEKKAAAVDEECRRLTDEGKRCAEGKL